MAIAGRGRLWTLQLQHASRRRLSIHPRHENLATERRRRRRVSRYRPSQVNGESHRRPDGPRLSPCSSGLSKAARLAAHYRLSPCTYAMSFATATICIAVPCHASFACPASAHSPRTPSARRAGGTSTNSILETATLVGARWLGCSIALPRDLCVLLPHPRRRSHDLVIQPTYN